MIMKPCPMCKQLYPYGKPYCENCMPIYEANKAKYKAENAKRYDVKRRGERETKFYKSKAWQKLAAATLARRGYKCERCGDYATQVHHKKYISTDEGWQRRFDVTNLEILCHKCHNEEHKRFLRKG